MDTIREMKPKPLRVKLARMILEAIAQVDDKIGPSNAYLVTIHTSRRVDVDREATETECREAGKNVRFSFVDSIHVDKLFVQPV